MLVEAGGAAWCPWTEVDRPVLIAPISFAVGVKRRSPFFSKSARPSTIHSAFDLFVLSSAIQVLAKGNLFPVELVFIQRLQYAFGYGFHDWYDY